MNTKAQMREQFNRAALDWAAACMMKRPIEECAATLDFAWSIAHQPATEQMKPLLEAAQAMGDTLAAIEPLLPTQKLVDGSKYARKLHRQALATIEHNTEGRANLVSAAGDAGKNQETGARQAQHGIGNDGPSTIINQQESV